MGFVTERPFEEVESEELKSPNIQKTSSSSRQTRRWPRSSAPNVCVPSRCRSSWVTIWRRSKGLPPKDPLTTHTTFIAYRNSSSYFTTLPNTSTYFKIYIETCLHFAPVWY